MKHKPTDSRGFNLAAVFLSVACVISLSLAQPAAADEREQAQIQELRTQVAQQQAEIAALQANQARQEQTIARLTAANQVTIQASAAKDAQIAQQTQLIQKQIATLGELQARVADLSQALISERAERRRTQETFLRVQAENAALIKQLADAKRRIPPDINPAPDPKPDPNDWPDVKGEVVKVDQVGDNLTFVQLDLGSRDKLVEGMALIVYRGDTFVGKVRIDAIDETESVGKLILGKGVQAGDKVKTSKQSRPDNAEKPEETDPPAHRAPKE